MYNPIASVGGAKAKGEAEQQQRRQRLLAVSGAVRAWLFPPEEPKPTPVAP